MRRLRCSARGWLAIAMLGVVGMALTLANLGARPRAVHGQPFYPTVGAFAVGGPNGSQGITATGIGSITVAPDEAMVSGAVLTQATTATDALNQNSTAVQAVLAAAGAAGITDANLQTTQLSINPIFSYATPSPSNGVTPPPQITAFQVTEGISATTTDLKGVGSLVQGLVQAGLNDFYGIGYGFQNPEALRTQAILAASADAQKQAQALAGSLNVTLGSVIASSILSSSAPSFPYVAPPQVSFPSVTRAVIATPLPVAPPVQPAAQSANATVSVTYAIAAP